MTSIMTSQQYRESDSSGFPIYRLAEVWKKSVPEVYRTRKDTDILGGYAFTWCDTLHTMGSEALVDDTTVFAHERGTEI